MVDPIIGGTRYPFKTQQTIDSEVLVFPRLSMSLHVSPCLSKVEEARGRKTWITRILISSNIPSGYAKIAIENGHRNS